MIKLMRDLFQVTLHLRHSPQNDLPMPLQQFASLPKRLVALAGQFHKPGYVRQGHTRVLQAADQTEGLQVLIGILAKPALAPAYIGQEPLFLVISKGMRRQTRFLANLVNRIHDFLRMDRFFVLRY